MLGYEQKAWLTTEYLSRRFFTGRARRASWVGLLTMLLLLSMAALAHGESFSSGGCPSSWNGSIERCVIGTATASGESAVAAVGGGAHRPDFVDLQVQTSRPERNIYVTWAITCARGNGAGTSTGHRSVNTVFMPSTIGGVPVDRYDRGNEMNVRFGSQASFYHGVPFPMADPSSCTFGATAQLHGTATLRLTLLAFQRP